MNSLSISRQCCRHLHLNVETEYLWDSLALISDQPTGVGEHVLMFFRLVIAIRMFTRGFYARICLHASRYLSGPFFLIAKNFTGENKRGREIPGDNSNGVGRGRRCRYPHLHLLSLIELLMLLLHYTRRHLTFHC